MESEVEEGSTAWRMNLKMSPLRSCLSSSRGAGVSSMLLALRAVLLTVDVLVIVELTTLTAVAVLVADTCVIVLRYDS